MVRYVHDEVHLVFFCLRDKFRLHDEVRLGLFLFCLRDKFRLHDEVRLGLCFVLFAW